MLVVSDGRVEADVGSSVLLVSAAVKVDGALDIVSSFIVDDDVTSPDFVSVLVVSGDLVEVDEGSSVLLVSATVEV